jgi:hypothetical protein
MKTATVLLASSLFLFSCGADASPDRAQAPDAAAAEPPIELTDALMETYLTIVKQAKAADNSGVAYLSRHGWSLEQWMKVSAAVTQGLTATSRIQLGDAAAKSKADLDERIAAIEKQLETAPAAERAELQKQLDALKAGRSTFGKLEPVTDLERRNAATVERWKPKLDALSKPK